MTDIGPDLPRWVPLLQSAASASGHELRNALNAVVVNLEVVRSRASAADESIQPFIAQAVEQSGESVRLAEATIALLELLVNAVGNGGRLRCELSGPCAISIATDPRESDRATRALKPMQSRGVFRADASGSAVILTIPETRKRDTIT